MMRELPLKKNASGKHKNYKQTQKPAS